MSSSTKNSRYERYRSRHGWCWVSAQLCGWEQGCAPAPWELVASRTQCAVASPRCFANGMPTNLGFCCGHNRNTLPLFNELCWTSKILKEPKQICRFYTLSLKREHVEAWKSVSTSVHLDCISLHCHHWKDEVPLDVWDPNNLSDSRPRIERKRKTLE